MPRPAAAGRTDGQPATAMHRSVDRVYTTCEDYAAYWALSHHGVYSERNAKLLREVNDLLQQLALVHTVNEMKSKSL
jgi:hypothetical protein